jgi:hypothetical protein
VGRISPGELQIRRVATNSVLKSLPARVPFDAELQAMLRIRHSGNIRVK